MAQEPPPRAINGGVLNGKAISLPKPAYPPAARAVGASGAVSVQVLIDENGDVVSATAISGHPLLRAVAVPAARASKFSPTMLEGIPVKVSGIIVYNFVGTLSLARLTFALSHAEETGSFGRYSAPDSLASQLPEDWIQEKQILSSLTFEETVQAQTPTPPEKKPVKKQADESTASPLPKDTVRYTVKGDLSAAGSTGGYGSKKLDAKSVGTVQNLLNLVETRASETEASTWTFELGKALGVLVANVQDSVKFQANLSTIESLVDRAPAGVVQFSLGQVKEFVNQAKKEDLNDENRQILASKAEVLSNLRY
jgi:TonB family protein